MNYIEILYKLYKNNYKKNNKMIEYNQFLLKNENWKFIIKWFKSILFSNEIYSWNKRNFDNNFDDNLIDNNLINNN